MFLLFASALFVLVHPVRDSSTEYYTSYSIVAAIFNMERKLHYVFCASILLSVAPFQFIPSSNRIILVKQPSSVVLAPRCQMCKRSTLSMHMGHSHSHHEHHDQNNAALGKKKKQPIHIQRKMTRIFFAAVATLLPPLLLRKRISNANLVIFALTSTALSFAERMRHEVKFLLNKAKNIRDGLVKHSPPTMNASEYLFANDNAADRVTLVGVLVNLVLSVGKAVVGVTCHSSALVADAGHSLSDLFSDFITLWAVQSKFCLEPFSRVTFSFARTNTY